MLEDALLKIALDLSLSLPKKVHYQRLIKAINEVVPCDAAALLELRNGILYPVAIDGLSPEVLNMQFLPGEHPRLNVILSNRKPVHFDSDSKFPDPYDGLLAIDPDRKLDVHACMGCSLYVEDNLVGILTLDALEVGAFNNTDDLTIATLAALAAATIRNANLISKLEKQNQKRMYLTNELVKDAHKAKCGDFIGESKKMRELKSEIMVVAHSDLSVLITGETGVGKEVVARTVHAESNRNNEAIVQINCAALSESLAESELFGHIKGAFTGATKDRMGKFELANNGTLFLDEIGELCLNTQAKLLRAIQHGEIQRVGVDRNIYVNVRIIAATNRDLAEEVSKGRFREDLYHRLSVFPLKVPPLRERVDDIPLLCDFILYNAKHKITTKDVKLSEEAINKLMQYDWPGNVRELQHVLMRAVLRTTSTTQDDSAVIKPCHLGVDFLNEGESNLTVSISDTKVKSFTELVADYQRQLISHVMNENDNVWAKAARQLQLDRGNLYRQAKRLGMV